MTAVDAIILHLFATPVVFVAMGFAVWFGVVKRRNAAILLALFAAIPTLVACIALLSVGDGSLWWDFTFSAPAVVTVIFIFSNLVTNRASVTIQVGCLAILPFFGALVLVDGVGIVFLWSWLLMIAS